MTDAKSIRAVEQIDRATFDAEIRYSGQPVILKGIATHWPAVQAAQTSPQALGNYLRQYDSGHSANVGVAPPDQNGRFFYNDTLTGVNYDTHKAALSQVVGWCLAIQGQQKTESVYLQAQSVDQIAPRMAGQLPMPLLDDAVRPRIWLGNSLTTQTHFDYDSNIAVHVAGKKTFTLFAPEQTRNLYPGPLDLTPAGVPISMASLENPDFIRFPRLAEALENAVTAELAPGDGLFIPPLWWHHVQTTGPLNMLVNYWWTNTSPLFDPLTVLGLAALAYRDMPASQRKAWQDLLGYFVFEDDDPVAHLPSHVPSPFRPNLTSEQALQIRQRLLRT